jgi:hypothetical protein
LSPFYFPDYAVFERYLPLDASRVAAETELPIARGISRVTAPVRAGILCIHVSEASTWYQCADFEASSKPHVSSPLIYVLSPFYFPDYAVVSFVLQQKRNCQ